MPNPSIRTYSGVKFDLLEPKANMVLLEDIARALAGIFRFTGYTRYSVAQHSVFVADRVTPVDSELRLWALLHDAHEAYVGDVSAPLKEAIRQWGEPSRYDLIATGVQRAILQHLGLPLAGPPTSFQEIIKLQDKIACDLEAAQFLWPRFQEINPAGGTGTGTWLPTLLPDEAAELWLNNVRTSLDAVRGARYENDPRHAIYIHPGIRSLEDVSQFPQPSDQL
jgi:5'-deoxynucleotidase YfbR-like HD superfamily hydrolase